MEVNSQKDLKVRFTDEFYAKREDIRAALNTSLIDPIWAKILDYRSTYNKILHISNLAKRNYYICFVSSVHEKCNIVLAYLNKCVTSYLSLDKNNQDKLIDECLKKEIKYLTNAKNIYINDDLINLILQNKISELQGLSEEKKGIANYIKFIKADNVSAHYDEDFLAKAYIALSEEYDITSMYRSFNFKNNENIIINYEYNGVPYQQIERMMNELIAFVNSDDESSIVKASMAYFYINYVKPFPRYNEEIALLSFRHLLALDINNDLIKYLPFSLLLKQKSQLDVEFKETNKNNDFTYTLLKCNEIVNAILEEFISDFDEIKVTSLVEEHDVSHEDIEKEIKIEEVKIEENKVEEKPIEVTQVKEEEFVPERKVNLGNIDEKDANKFAKYLMEKNPLLSKKEAHFYARHSTIGSYYTIQMYKNFEHVVYETARTSMDALAKFGYYKKEQIKNKFVYTPIKIEGN